MEAIAANDNYVHSLLNIRRQVVLNNLQALGMKCEQLIRRMDKDVRDYQAGRK